MLEFDGWLNVELSHALDASAPEKFTSRGNVTVTSLQTGSFSVAQNPLTKSERTQLKVRFYLLIIYLII